MSGSTPIGKDDLPCIWVLAGVLSYRLCDRNYECEGCELFRVLRGREDATPEVTPAGTVPRQALDAEVAAVEDQVSAYLWHLMAGCELHLDRPYSPGHFWLREEGGGETAAGLDGHVMRILYPIDDIVAPRPGVWLRRDEPCGWIMRGRAAIPLETPISGEVLAVNDHYRSAVRRGRATGNGDEWLFRLSTHEAVAEVRTLHRGEETLVWFLKKIQLLKRHIRGAVAGDAAELGVMLADGGVPNPNLGAVLGPDRFAALVDELFHMHI